MAREGWIAAGPDLAGQMAERDRLVAAHRDAVIGLRPAGETAAVETLDMVVAHVRNAGWPYAGNVITRPDGVAVRCDRDDPMGALCRLVPEDLCLMVRTGDEEDYRLQGATLCFPSHWRLLDKLGHGLNHIHGPVPHYTADTEKRVNRVFHGIRVETPLERVNWAVATAPDLFTPAAPHDAAPGAPILLRVERQTFVRLPRSQAVVFGIRTAFSTIDALTPDEAAGWLAAIADLSDKALAYKGGAALFDRLRPQLEALAAG